MMMMMYREKKVRKETREKIFIFEFLVVFLSF